MYFVSFNRILMIIASIEAILLSYWRRRRWALYITFTS